MNNKNVVSVTREEILELMTESYKAGVSSYYDLAQESCGELLSAFLNKKTNPVQKIDLSVNNANVSISGNSSSWNWDNFNTFVSNVFVS